MLDITLSWTNLKALGLTLSYVSTNGNYYIYASNTSVSYTCVITQNGGADQTDFETTYKTSATNLG